MHTGKRRPGDVEIVEGIAENERVVVEGTQNMRDGTRVDEAPLGASRRERRHANVRAVRPPPGVRDGHEHAARDFRRSSRCNGCPCANTRTSTGPSISITTNYSGASSAVIETKITQPIEDAVAGIEGINKIESDSEDERSQVRIEFDVSRDVDAAANDVRDRVARVVGALPDESRPAADREGRRDRRSGRDTSAFSSDPMSMLELTDYAERNFVDRLSTVPGVARVNIIGARRYSMRDLDRSPGARGAATHRRATSRTRCAARTSSCRPDGSSRGRASSRCARWSASRPRRISATS